jgi:hypothetical protein
MRFGIFIFCLYLFSCEVTEKRSFTNESFDLKIDFTPSVMSSGCVFDKTQGKYLFYFGDLMSYKQISFYNSKFEFSHVVSVADVIKKHGQISSISVLDKDSIFIFCKNARSIILVNSTSQISNIMSITPFDDRANYNIASSANAGFVSTNGNLIFRKRKIIVPQNSDSNLKSFQISLRNFTENYTYVECLNPFTDSSSWIEINDFKHFSFINKFCGEIETYIPLDKTVLFTSMYKDNIYTLNKENGKLDSIPVISKFSTSRLEGFDLNDESIADIPNNYNRMFVENGFVYNYFFNKNLNYFFVFLLHKLNKADNGSRNFSVLVYNREMKFVTELLIDSEKYYSNFIIPSKNGFVLFNKKTPKNEKKITLFNFDF